VCLRDLLVGGEAIVRWLMYRGTARGGLPDADANVTLPEATTGGI